MTMTRLLGAAAVAALIAGSAYAQTPTAAATKTPAAPPAAATTPTAPAEEAAPAPSAAPATAATPAAVAPAAAGQVVAKGDIVETLKADGHFTTFVKAIDAANMTSVLKTNSNLTVFAPNDAAFAALPAGELDKLMKDPAALQKLLTYHVVNATVDSTKIKGAKGGVKTVAGSELMLDGSGATPMANNATIVQADVKATNGTVHVVDKVLMPGGATDTATAAAAPATTGATTDAAATAPAAPAAKLPPTPGTKRMAFPAMPPIPPSTRAAPVAPDAAPPRPGMRHFPHA
ncbi:MAG: fasciclin domain-containing protein [Pseudomonadota bacterium]